MENKNSLMQLIDEDGNFNVIGLNEFMRKTQLSECGLSYGVVSVMGPQSGGKSTLLNHLFYTNFREMDASKGRNKTTQGIWIEKCAGIEPSTVAMDLEGSDGMERGEDNNFEKQSALFALLIADIMIVNMCCKDVGKEQAASKPLLRTIFQIMMEFNTPSKTLLFTLRDKTKSSVEYFEDTMRDETEKLWNSISKPKSFTRSFRECFKVEVVVLPNYEEKEGEFKIEVAKLRQKLLNSLGRVPGDRQRVPTSEFPFRAQRIWERIKEHKHLNIPSLQKLAATVKCEEIANQKLHQLLSDEHWLALERAIPSGPLSGFGRKLRSILEAYFSEYDNDAIYYHEGVRIEKRKQLESKASEFVHPACLKLLHRLRSETHERFRSRLDDMLKQNNEFKASVESCKRSAMHEFDHGCQDAAIGHYLHICDTSTVQEELKVDITQTIEAQRVAHIRKETIGIAKDAAMGLGAFAAGVGSTVVAFFIPATFQTLVFPAGAAAAASFGASKVLLAKAAKGTYRVKDLMDFSSKTEKFD